MLLLYTLWDDWPILMISASNEQLQQELEYTLQKPDSHGWWISKMQSDTLEERYAIKLCFKLGKMSCDESWIYCYDQETKKQSSSGSMMALPGPRRPDRANPPTNFWWSLFWQDRHDLYALGSHQTNSQQGILCWGFKGVQVFGSVAFPPGQCTRPQLHPCHRLFDQDGYQECSSASL